MGIADTYFEIINQKDDRITQLEKHNSALAEQLASVKERERLRMDTIKEQSEKIRGLEAKLAEAEKKIKSFDAYVCRDEKLAIAIEALERIAKTHHNLGAGMAREALKQIRGEA